MTENRWAVIKHMDYTSPIGSSENIKKGYNKLNLEIWTTENLKPFIKDILDNKEGSTQHLLDVLSRIAIEP